MKCQVHGETSLKIIGILCIYLSASEPIVARLWSSLA